MIKLDYFLVQQMVTLDLIKKCSVGAEERELGERGSIVGADVERLALGLDVRVVAAFNPSVARKRRFRNFSQNGIVLPWDQ